MIRKIPLTVLIIIFILIFYYVFFAVVLKSGAFAYDPMRMRNGILLYFAAGGFAISFIYSYYRNYSDRPKTYPSDTNLSKKLEEYCSKHEPTKYLENNNIILLCEGCDEEVQSNKIYIRCINKKNQSFFTITGEPNLIATVWLIFQYEFNNNFTYKGLRVWYSDCEFYNTSRIRLIESN